MIPVQRSSRQIQELLFTMSSKFTLKQVAERSNSTAGVIVIDKKVYDITDYMSKHPYVFLSSR